MKDLSEPSPFLRDVLRGLAAEPKALPPKWFYDAEGSRLFEAITETPEYYPTRTETTLLHAIVEGVAARIPPGAVLVEFGSGSATKTRILLDALPALHGYVPIDISREPLERSAAELRADYPGLTVDPLEADFTRAVELPASAAGRPHVGFFPGSTIGNVDPGERREFLRNARRLLGDGALFLVGFDLVKGREVLEAAYDDAAGVTAAFNRNLLHRMNRELSAGLDADAFDYRSVWNAEESRVEAHLVSRAAQVLRIDGRDFEIAAGESIHTENAYKFTPESIASLASEAGWAVDSLWTSPPPAFAEALLRAG